MNREQIRKALTVYGVSPTDDVCEKVNSYIELLVFWNKKMALTTVSEPSDILNFHFGESVFALQALEMSSGNLIDVGSGAGFPGLPLKIICPGLSLTLIESNNKKATFLSEVIRELNLADAQVFRGRMQDYSPQALPDFVTARAFGQFADLLSWATGTLKTGGAVLLWLGLRDAQKLSHEVGWAWSQPVDIPNSNQRCILVGHR